MLIEIIDLYRMTTYDVLRIAHKHILMTLSCNAHSMIVGDHTPL